MMQNHVRDGRIHNLKTWPEYFQKVVTGEKTFEIRKDDCHFQVGDILLLQEWDPKTEKYTGQQFRVKVSYITNFAQHDGVVVMSFKRLISLT